MAEAAVLVANLADVQARLNAAAVRAERDPKEVRIVAVTKLVDPAWIPLALGTGLRRFGENRSNDLVRKAKLYPAAEWHFIGRMHSRDPKRLRLHAAAIHSVGSVAEMDRCADLAAVGDFPPVMLQCNTSEEAAKQGLTPDQAISAVAGIRAASARGLRVVGLMTMAPWGAEDQTIRACFRRLAELRDVLREETGLELPELSMGMSDDFELAVEEGATLIRLGRALFGERTH